jgi:hypothetical protein
MPFKPPPYSQADPQGDELAGLQRQLAPARQPHRLVQRGSHRGLARPRRPRRVFAAGNPDHPDAAHCVPTGSAPDQRLEAQLLVCLASAWRCPPYSTLRRRAETMEVPQSRSMAPSRLVSLCYRGQCCNVIVHLEFKYTCGKKLPGVTRWGGKELRLRSSEW